MDGTLKIPSVTGIDVELRIAGPGGRSYAFIIDWHIRVLLALGWFLAGALLYAGSINAFARLEESTSDFFLIVALPAIALYLLYHPVLEVAMRGRTPGKRIAGVRVIRRDGGVPGVGALLVRNVFRLVDSLPFLYCVGLTAAVLTQHSVRVGDMAAGTLLVYDDGNAATFDDAPSSRGIERLGLERAELVRDLLSRWHDLRPDTRRAFARQLLEQAHSLPAQAGDESLRHALEGLLK